MAAPTNCVTCGAPIPKRQGRGRTRIRCEGCSPSRSKTRAPAPVAVIPAAPDGGAPAMGPVESSALARLSAAGVQATPESQVALRLARHLDGTDTGSSLAAVARQFDAALEKAMGDVREADDPVDALKQRRDAKMRGA